MATEDDEVDSFFTLRGILGAIWLVIRGGNALGALQLLTRRIPSISAGAAARIVGFGSSARAAAVEMQRDGKVSAETLASVPRASTTGRQELGYSVVVEVTTEAEESPLHVTIHQPATAETTVEQLTAEVLQQLNEKGDDSPRLAQYQFRKMDILGAWRS